MGAHRRSGFHFSEDYSMRSKSSTGVTVATAAALLFGTAFVGTAVAGTEAASHCAGVNSCKGQSACKSANNACKGQNSCKGKGYLEMTKAACAAAKAKAKDGAK
jgi:heme A synthase